MRLQTTLPRELLAALLALKLGPVLRVHLDLMSSHLILVLEHVAAVRAGKLVFVLMHREVMPSPFLGRLEDYIAISTRAWELGPLLPEMGLPHVKDEFVLVRELFATLVADVPFCELAPRDQVLALVLLEVLFVRGFVLARVAVIAVFADAVDGEHVVGEQAFAHRAVVAAIT